VLTVNATHYGFVILTRMTMLILNFLRVAVVWMHSALLDSRIVISRDALIIHWPIIGRPNSRPNNNFLKFLYSLMSQTYYRMVNVVASFLL
jgi:hypothetical protein